MSLISTYQSRKSLFAEKLEDKGVEASATDGLTTLINKIEDIEGGFTEGLLLYAENSIVQKDGTVDLYALLLQDGKPVPNKTVDFIGLYTVIAGKVCHVPPHYRFEKFGYMNATVYLDADHHFKIGSGALFYKDDVEQSSAKVYSIEVNQNTLTVGYIGGTTSTFDVSNYDMSVIESTVNISDIICYASGTTGSDGVASYTYTGVGEGLKEVYAKYGTLVSEIYELWDYLVYDDGVHSEYDKWTASGNPTIVRGEEYTQITTDGLTTANVGHSTYISGDFELLIEMETADTIRFGFYGGSGKYTRLQINATNSKFYLYKIRRESGVFTSQVSTNGGQSWTNITYYEQDTVGSADCSVLFYIPVPSGNPRSVKFKNLRAYSI